MEMDLLNPVDPANLTTVETCGMLEEEGLDLALAPVEVEEDPLQEPGTKTETMTGLSLMLTEIDLIGEVNESLFLSKYKLLTIRVGLNPKK